MDILIFAVLAALVFFKLINNLGRRSGHEQPPPVPMSPPVADNDDSGTSAQRLADKDASGDGGLPEDADDALKAGIAQIRLADSGFDMEQFLAGARAAFGMILDAFHKGEIENVRSFLDREVHRSFADAIASQADSGTTRLVELVTINSCEPVEATVDGHDARVTVRFESEQTNIVKDSEDRIVAGDPTVPGTVTDIWTFSRNTRSRDPNWILVATRSAQ